MEPRDKSARPDERTIRDDAPSLETQDWDAIETGAVTSDGAPRNGDLGYDAEKPGEAPEEDDDNAYQNSDEALPNDEGEAAISRRPSREGSRFDEV